MSALTVWGEQWATPQSEERRCRGVLLFVSLLARIDELLNRIGIPTQSTVFILNLDTPYQKYMQDEQTLARLEGRRQPPIEMTSSEAGFEDQFSPELRTHVRVRLADWIERERLPMDDFEPLEEVQVPLKAKWGAFYTSFTVPKLNSYE